VADGNWKPISCLNAEDGTVYRVRDFDEYVVCECESPLSFLCPENTQFDSTYAPIPCSFVCPKIGKYSHENYYDKYYDCRCDGQKCYTIKSCTNNRLFNQTSAKCEYYFD
jgi:hypothetical protein